jgi:hypothetical protein
MSPVGYVAYIDESGDDGTKTVTPIDPSGASEWFVLGAVVVPIHEDAFVHQWLSEALRRLKSRQRTDIHFAKLDDGRKETLCRYLASLNFRWFASVSHKPNMRGHRNVRAEKVGSRNYFYNWMARILLEKVTKYCLKDSSTRYRGEPPRKLRIEFSARGGMFYPHTRDYTAGLTPQRGRTMTIWTGLEGRGFCRERRNPTSSSISFGGLAPAAPHSKRRTVSLKGNPFECGRTQFATCSGTPRKRSAWSLATGDTT